MKLASRILNKISEASVGEVKKYLESEFKNLLGSNFDVQVDKLGKELILVSDLLGKKSDKGLDDKVWKVWDNAVKKFNIKNYDFATARERG